MRILIQMDRRQKPVEMLRSWQYAFLTSWLNGTKQYIELSRASQIKLDIGPELTRIQVGIVSQVRAKDTLEQKQGKHNT